MLHKKCRFLALLLILTMIFSSVSVLAYEIKLPSVKRIAGVDRYDTSIKVSEAGFEKSEYAVIASGQTFPDALVGGVLASRLKAPLLITPKDEVKIELLNELNRLEVKKIYLLGGKNTITEAVETALSNFEIQRIEGENRYETARLVSKEVERLIREQISGDYQISMYQASGRNFPDALSVVPLVSSGPSILLLGEEVITDGSVVPVGGVNSLPGFVPDRIHDNDRYGTALNIALRLNSDSGKFILVDGTNYADALSAGSFASGLNSPILLTDPSYLHEKVEHYIKSRGINEVFIIGGENSISSRTENMLRSKIPDVPYNDIVRIVEGEVDVLEVVDPYTIIADVQGREEIIRMNGVSPFVFAFNENTGEENCDIDVLTFTKEKLLGKKVKLTFDVKDRDEYNRSLAYIWLEDSLFNETLIREGLALESSEFPNLLYMDRLLEAKKDAIENRKGIWTQECNGIPRPTYDDAPSPTLKAHLFSRPLIIGEKSTMKYYKLGQDRFKEINYGDSELFAIEHDAINAGYTAGE